MTDEVYFNTHPRIYVGRLNGTVKRKELVEMFVKYGDIVDILMKEDFAFVEYIKPEAAQQAIKELNGRHIGSARIVVEEARPRIEEGGLSIPRIYVGHLSNSVKKSDLYFLFSKYGDIVELMMKDDFAFVEYSNVQSAYRALTELNGVRLGGTKLQIEEAKPREGESSEEFYHRPRSLVAALGAEEQIISKPTKRRRASPRRSLTRSRSRSQDCFKD